MIKFIDTTREYKLFEQEIKKRHEKILESGLFLFGQETETLEKNFGKISGKECSVSVKNCTDAIILVLKKIYQEGMTIILPNFGAYPTPVACRNITNNIYYVDVDDTMTIDPNKLPKSIKNGIIIPVHLFGNNCDMKRIMEYAQENNHIVIEDCAQSTGSGSGGDGHYSVFSFYPTKPLASMGDGGMICFNNPEDINYFKKTRFYGQVGTYVYDIGINSRMDEFQAAVVNTKIDHFHDLNAKRIQNAVRFKKVIKGIRDRGSVYHQFTVSFKDREKIINDLKNAEIPYMVHYYYHLSEIDILKGIYNEVGNRLNDKIISLPVHPFLEEEELNKIENFLYDHRKDEYRISESD